MSGWDTVETARCSRCAIYTPTSDLYLDANGRACCLSCGEPGAASVAVDDALADEWVRLPSASTAQRVRVVAALMLILSFAFPFAACSSQL